jgi:hypothetical protein
MNTENVIVDDELVNNLINYIEYNFNLDTTGYRYMLLNDLKFINGNNKEYDKVMGLHDSKNSIIYINRLVHQEIMKETSVVRGFVELLHTLIHEMTHADNYLCGIPHQDYRPEFTDRLKYFESVIEVCYPIILDDFCLEMEVL